MIKIDFEPRYLERWETPMQLARYFGKPAWYLKARWDIAAAAFALAVMPAFAGIHDLIVELDA